MCTEENCTTLWMCLISLYRRLRNCYDQNFMPCIFHYYFLKRKKLVAQTAIYYSVCRSGMWAELLYFILILYWPLTWVTITPVLPLQASWVFSHDCFTLFLTKSLLWPDELVFYWCDKTPQPRKLMKERVYLDWWFQSIGAHEDKGSMVTSIR